MPLRWLLSLIAGAALTAAFLLATDVPLGVPGEWAWKRTDFTGGLRDALLGAAAAGITITAYGALLHFGRNSIERCSPLKTAGWLTALVVSATAVLFALESTTPGDYPAARQAWVLYDPGASGYFFEAAHSRTDAAEFLRGYEAKMAEGDVLHIGTHPPGLILLHRRLLAACRESPAFSRLVLATQPDSVAAAFERIERAARLTPRPPPDSDRAALWLAVLLTHLVAAATVVPLFCVVRQDFGPRTAWSVAAFWPLVPAVAVFLPKSDALYPFVGMLFLWCWRTALRRRSFVAAVVAGLILFGGLLLSLAMLPVALFAVLLTAFETFAVSEAASFRTEAGSFGYVVKRNALLAVAAIAAFVAAVCAFLWTTRANLPAIWEWNYRNHAAFYAQPSFPRTWWKWLPVNLVEFVLSVGWPATLLAGAVVFRAFKVAFRSAKGCFAGGSTNDNDPLGGRRRSFAPLWAGLCVIGLLWLSGKNMGEAGRLWLFVDPWVLWMSAGFWNESPATRTGRGAWYVVLALQAAVAIVTVMSVQAFHHIS
jgi:methylthioxylose transferase